MGRPLNKKYFGNRNIGSTTTAADDGIGGQAVASVPNATGLTGMTYLTGGPYTILAADIGAPQLPGGVKPVLTFQPTSATAGTIQVVDGGSGYTSAPTVLVRGSLASGTGTTTKTAVLATDTGNVGSATNDENAITCYAKTTSGGTRQVGDIIKQVSTNRYKVKTADGTYICKLVTDGSTGYGKMDITAYDTGSGGSNEYWVTKLTSRTTTLVAKGGGAGGTDFTNGKQVKWTFGSAVAPSGANIGVAKIQNA